MSLRETHASSGIPHHGYGWDKAITQLNKKLFKPGDVVVHARRPEWGQGVIHEATAIQHQGQPAQRLVVRFVNHGRITLNTAYANLQPKGSNHTMTSTTTTSGSPTPATNQGWLGTLEKNPPRELWSLPEAMTDPFAGLSGRLNATLDSYRFNAGARSLIEWAAAQSGLTDPLTAYSRHELEQAFARFTRDRDQHLVELVRTAKKQHKNAMLNQMAQETRFPAAREALQKAIRG